MSDQFYKLSGLGVYLLILLVIGIVASRRMKTLSDFIVGGKRFGFFSAAFSARATGESAWLLLGLTGMGAAIGVQAFWVVVGEVLGVGVAWIFMARRFKSLTDRYDSITVPDYLESRFRENTHLLRMVSAIALVIFVTVYVSAQIDATGQAFEKFLGWNYFHGALLGFFIVILYTTFGGFIAVVWSDVFQGIMMVLGLVVLPIVGLISAGGLGAVLEGLGGQDPILLSWVGAGGWTATNIAYILSLLTIGLGFLGSPQIFVRFISLKSKKEIGRGTVVAIVWTVLADSGAVLVGMVGRHLLGAEGMTEDVLPNLVAHLMPALIVGIYIAIVLAAIMSTVDSLLMVATSAAVRDYYQKTRNPNMSGESLVGFSRIATVALALVALGVAMAVALLTKDRTIFWFVIFGWSGIAATFCPTIILSLFWSRFTAKGALLAMISGFVCVPVFKFVAPALAGVGGFFNALGELPPAFLVSGTIGVIASLTDSKGREKLPGIADELRESARD
ncbi:MAG: sodium/proline symporter [bacterium]|nr:sodium/proline symporter [bacterium]